MCINTRMCIKGTSHQDFGRVVFAGQTCSQKMFAAGNIRGGIVKVAIFQIEYLRISISLSIGHYLAHSANGIWGVHGYFLMLSDLFVL